MKLAKKGCGTALACTLTLLLSATAFAEDTTLPNQAPAATKDTYTQQIDTATVSNPVLKSEKQKQIEDFVKSAADFIKKNGKEAALAEFRKKDGAFSKGETYISSVDYRGKILANPHHPEWTNKNRYNIKMHGQYATRDVIAKAKAGDGWITYLWENPVSKTVECRNTYVMSIDKDYIIGSGYFEAPGPDGKCSP